MNTLPNDLSLPADQSWAQMILDNQQEQDDFNLLKTQEFELPEEA
jgi:hypothetical protein